MNKRGKATVRAVSPDIVSLSTNSAKKNAGKGKGKNGKTEKTGEEQQQQQQELQDSVVFNNNVSLIVNNPAFLLFMSLSAVQLIW